MSNRLLTVTSRNHDVSNHPRKHESATKSIEHKGGGPNNVKGQRNGQGGCTQGLRAKALGFRVPGSGFRFQGLG